MGVLTRAMGKSDTRSWNALGLTMMGGYSTNAGVSVTQTSSLQNTAVYACVRILSETIASLPLNVYENVTYGVKKKARRHYLQTILHDLPNPEMTSFELREMLMAHLALWGNAYAEIQRNNSGNVMALWPLRPDRMTVTRENGLILYRYEVSPGDTVTLTSDRVMHVRGLSHDGLVGYSPIAIARQAVGLAMATEEFGSRFFSNGARPGVVLEHPGQLSDDAQNRLRKSVNTTHQGLNNAHRLMILEEGMKLETLGIPPNDAQFLETRKFQIAEIARIFNVPLHKIGDLEHATFSNIEHQGIEFVVHTIRPWLVRFEQAMRRDLFQPRERGRYFAEFVVDGLLRGDIESRYNAYATARQNGWLSANDIRALENMNPVDGGNEYLVPLNMIPASQTSAQRDSDAQSLEFRGMIDEASEKREQRAQSLAVKRHKLMSGYYPVVQDAVTRVLNREIADVRRAVTKYLRKRSASDFRQWLETFYTDHRAVWEQVMKPIMLAYAHQLTGSVADELGKDAGSVQDFIDEYLTVMAGRNTRESELQLKALLDEAAGSNDDPADLVEARLDGWQDTRAAQTAHSETFRGGNAITRALYVASGVTLLRWATVGDNCPYCRAMNGKTVGVDEWFLPAHTDFSPEGAATPLNIRHNAAHPPIHKGCDCQVVAG